MAKPTALEALIALKTWGRFGVPYQFGERIYGKFRYGREEFVLDNKRNAPLKRYGVYQRRVRNGKQIVVRSRFYHPANPQTPTQQAHRTTFANGMGAWALLTPAEKAVYNQEAKRLKLHGVNLFMREYLRSN